MSERRIPGAGPDAPECTCDYASDSAWFCVKHNRQFSPEALKAVDIAELSLSRVGPRTITLPQACSSPGFTAMIRCEETTTVQNAPPCAHHSELARARELLEQAVSALGVANAGIGVQALIRAFLEGGGEPDASQSNWAAFNGIGRAKPTWQVSTDGVTWVDLLPDAGSDHYPFKRPKP